MDNYIAIRSYLLELRIKEIFIFLNKKEKYFSKL